MHGNDSIKVMLIEPGMVDTPFFDNKPTGALEADDIAAAVAYAVSQPDRVDVNEILIRPVAIQPATAVADIQYGMRTGSALPMAGDGLSDVPRPAS